MKNEPFVIERTYHAPLERVWRALTDKEQMKEWYFDTRGFKPEVGCEFSFEGGTKEKVLVHLCKVLEVIPHKKIAYSWQYQGYPGYSVVTFELFPDGHITTVQLTHEGLESFPDTGDFAKTNFEKGWTHFIGFALKDYVEKADVLEP